MNYTKQKPGTWINGKSILAFAVFAFLIFPALLISKETKQPDSHEKLSLGINFEKGKTYSYQLYEKQWTIEMHDGTDFKIPRNESRSTQSWFVQDDATENAAIKIITDAIEYKTFSMVRNQPADPMTDIMKALEGIEFEIVMSPKGIILDKNVPEGVGISRSTLDDLSESTNFDNDKLIQTLRAAAQHVSEVKILQYSQMFDFVPENPVGVGDKWHKEFDIKILNNIGLPVALSYEVKQVEMQAEDTLVHITYSGSKVTPDGLDGSSDVEGDAHPDFGYSISGTIVYDAEEMNIIEIDQVDRLTVGGQTEKDQPVMLETKITLTMMKKE